MVDDREAIREIIGLSENAKNFLAHNLRNHIQVLLYTLEDGKMGPLQDSMESIDKMIKDLGL